MPPIVLPRHRLLCAVLAAALLAGACATVENPVTGRAERTVLAEKAEIAEGAKQHRQVLADYGAVQDAKLQAYVGDIGRRLAQHSHRPGLEWHFTVLDSDEVNAFALPGGYVYVTRGIMAYMESEADLAGVMGHEIGHVTARHGAQRETRAQVAGLGVLAATILGAAIGVGDLASELSQNVAAGYVAHYSREQESQADRLGAEYLARAGYDPHNMVDVIQVLKDQERFAADLARSEGRQPDEGAGWLASHPSSDQRLADMRAVATQYSGQPGHYGDDRRARYLAAVDGLVFGEGREQGVTRGRNFYHEPLGIALTAPPGWKIRNTPEAIVLAAGDASAGLVVRTVPPQAGATPQEVIRNVVKPDA
ncbi:MAG TPA: M48 family metalloprotease, partial [Ideonella sp.]|nr:M48 family metalloprotease [Ideonella sp.]